ncbi:MAG: endonuclease/exonuclease/phosphatase family protein [bacterium]|nr:endonuclease/exonuclease/phosphatase family protein [bacterium]
MKILSFNTVYGNGFNKGWWQYFVESWRYLYAGTKPFRRLVELVKELDPDVAAFTEIESGSYRVNFVNQITTLAKECDFKTVFYRAKSGPHSILKKLPVFKNFCNAILLKEESAAHQYHYLNEGVNRLVMQASIAPDIDLFLVHLALMSSVRKRQIRELSNLLKTNKKRIILTGDFNTFGGLPELSVLATTNKLRSVNHYNQPTFPSWAPKRELDFFLVSPDIHIKNFQVLPSDVSDHLPIFLEIE